jgi:RHS repeat-associated protein
VIVPKYSNTLTISTNTDTTFNRVAKQDLGLLTGDTIDIVNYSHAAITSFAVDSTVYEDGLYFYHGNHLSSTQLVTDIAGSISQAVLYAPFGQIISEYRYDWMLDTIPRYLFTGQELDEESGMYYYSARYYSPPVFTSRDPLFEEKPWMSPYAYCSNNPLHYIDPTGMSAEDPGDPGHYYGTDGREIYDDKIPDNKVYVQNENGDKILGPVGAFSEVSITNDELNLRSSLSTLKAAEAGSSNPPLDYNSWNGNDKFTNDSYSENPTAYSTHPGKNLANGRSAAGAYQFMPTTWSSLAQKNGYTDFSPINQDNAAVKNMTPASYNAALSGNMSSFKTTTSGRWTSLNSWSAGKLQTVFQQYRGNELQGKSNIVAPIGTLLKK